MRSLISCALICLFASSASAEAGFRAVFLAPVPIVIEFDISVTAGSIADQRLKYSEELLEDTDTNADGFVSREEAKQIEVLPGGTGKTLEEIWDRVDSNPADDKLSLEELRKLVDLQVGDEVKIDLTTSQAISAGPLETFLDENGDNLIKGDEYSAGFDRLRRVDFDDDNAVSMAELLTYQRNLGNPVVITPPFSAADNPELADRIVTSSKHDQQPRWQKRRWDEIDGNSDGKIDHDEAIDWLAQAPSDLIVRIDIDNSTRTGSRMKVSSGEARLKLARPERQRGHKKAAVQIGPPGLVTLNLYAMQNYGASDGVDFLKLRHIVADTDQNGYLSPEEFRGVDPKPGDYADIDRDDDKMLTSAELVEYLERVQRRAQLQVKLSAKNLTKSLFESIDDNTDNRLSPREVSMLAGQTRRADFGESLYQIEVSTDVVSFVTDTGMTRNGRQPTVRPRERDVFRGPEWFQRMDRNRDGDLMWREFLGPREVFDRLDANSDGFIEADEANEAQ